MVHNQALNFNQTLQILYTSSSYFQNRWMLGYLKHTHTHIHHSGGCQICSLRRHNKPLFFLKKHHFIFYSRAPLALAHLSSCVFKAPLPPTPSVLNGQLVEDFLQTELCPKQWLSAPDAISVNCTSTISHKYIGFPLKCQLLKSISTCSQLESLDMTVEKTNQMNKNNNNCN